MSCSIPNFFALLTKEIYFSFSSWQVYNSSLKQPNLLSSFFSPFLTGKGGKNIRGFFFIQQDPQKMKIDKKMFRHRESNPGLLGESQLS